MIRQYLQGKTYYQKKKLTAATAASSKQQSKRVSYQDFNPRAALGLDIILLDEDQDIYYTKQFRAKKNFWSNIVLSDDEESISNEKSNDIFLLIVRSLLILSSDWGHP